MAEPKLNTRQNERLTYNEIILYELRSMRQELNTRIDDLSKRMDRIEDRMQHMESEMRSGIRHAQILTVSVVGVALAVFYAAFR